MSLMMEYWKERNYTANSPFYRAFCSNVVLWNCLCFPIVMIAHNLDLNTQDCILLSIYSLWIWIAFGSLRLARRGSSSIHIGTVGAARRQLPLLMSCCKTCWNSYWNLSDMLWMYVWTSFGCILGHMRPKKDKPGLLMPSDRKCRSCNLQGLNPPSKVKSHLVTVGAVSGLAIATIVAVPKRLVTSVSMWGHLT